MARAAGALVSACGLVARGKNPFVLFIGDIRRAAGAALGRGSPVCVITEVALGLTPSRKSVVG